MADAAEDPNAWKRRTPWQSFGDIIKSFPVFTLYGLSIGYAVLHPPSWSQVWLAVATCAIAGIIVTLGYHRYFSHRSFKTSRAFQFVLAVLTELTLQKGPLWWAANHRVHHRSSDTEDDSHSPIHGWWWSHMGWTLHPNSHNNRRDDLIKDLLRFRELEILDKIWLLPPAIYLGILWWIGGIPAMMWGYLIPILTQFQCTYLINSACHIWGSQPFKTNDTSKNSLVLALLTMGEGWHNNHHYYQTSARQGFFAHEVDVTYWVILILERVGLIWEVKRPPEHVYAARGQHS